ncbi:MAG: BrnT family toxin [Acidiphilium sp.]
MDIEFGDAKETVNRERHGVSLALGLAVLENRVGEVMDDRQDYGEPRINAFGLIAGRLFACTYTMRGDIYRIISVRKASRQEQRKWLS